MKKSLFVAILLLAVVPSCFFKRKKTCTPTRDSYEDANGNVPSGYKKGDKKSLFVDDVDAFVLEDESDPFAAMPNDSTLRLIEADADQAWMSRAENSQNLKTVYFDFDQYLLRADQQEAFNFNLKQIKKLVDSGTMIVVEGHACKSAGSSVYNMMLSQKRAQIGADFLISHGIPANKVKVVGRGNEMCIVSDGSREQQAPNRRIELYALAA